VKSRGRIGVLLWALWTPVGSIAWVGAGETGSPSAEYKKTAGPYAVEVARLDWTDAKRNREVPVKIYFPQTGDGPFPAIVFSHGLGGSREGYEYLGRHWASHGYVSVHVQHKGSDTAVWQGNAKPMEAMNRAAADPQNAVARPLDIRFAIDQMEAMNREAGPLRGRLDLKRIGVAGHSFGAYTTLAAAGEAFVGPLGREFSLADPRVVAAIPMSAPVPRKRDLYDRAFGKIKIPCLHMTGTLDDSPIGNTPAADRRVPFDHIHGADQYLVIFKDGDHMIFSGRGRPEGLFGGKTGKKDARFQDLIRMSATAFWDAYLKDDGAAKSWLGDGGFEKVLDGDGTFEKKRGK
jgi:predicted dienelactone hydrolase